MGESEEPTVDGRTDADEMVAEPAIAEAVVPAEEPTAEDDLAAAIQEQLELVTEAESASDEVAPKADAAEGTTEGESGAATGDSAAVEILAETGDDTVVETPAETTDAELEAAIAASGEQVGEAATFDDIAPGTVQEVSGEELVVEPTARYGAPWWPFLVYLGLWVVLAGVAVWQIQQLPIGTVVYESQAYAVLVAAGLVMAAVGPILILAVWLGTRASETRHRAGLLTSALFKGGLVTFWGVVFWWGTLIALDYLRLGRPF